MIWSSIKFVPQKYHNYDVIYSEKSLKRMIDSEKKPKSEIYYFISYYIDKYPISSIFLYNHASVNRTRIKKISSKIPIIEKI